MNLGFILSLPRSGSTVLTAILDRKSGIICLPESSFPQILQRLDRKALSCSQTLAAYYLASTFPGSPLEFEEIVPYMKGEPSEMLTAIGVATAIKLGRDPDKLKTVVWKTTRTIGMNQYPIKNTTGKFLLLRRNPLNVFESQFRVGFGINNRKPYRFALFRESYESAFACLPEERILNIKYENIPDRIFEIMSFLGVAESGDWECGVSSLDRVAAECSWLSDISGKFISKDEDKINRVDPAIRKRLENAIRLSRYLNPLLPLARRHFDIQTYQWISRKAHQILLSRAR